MAKNKKQFKKEIVLSDEEIFVDAEAELEKQAFEEILKAAGKKQVWNKPPTTWYNIKMKMYEHMTHRLYLCIRYELDYSKNIGIDTEQCKVFNFDFDDRQGKTLPDYIKELGYDWTHFLNYDLAIHDKELRDYILKY